MSLALLKTEPDALGLLCPSCGQTSHVVADSRPGISGSVRRRRKCPCGWAWTTYEISCTEKHQAEKLAEWLSLSRTELNVMSELLNIMRRLKRLGRK